MTFASVTQQFSTTGSMGRLTLNILLSFAQFERDLTSERIRDKFAAMRSRGMRPQGCRPYGYRFVERRLEVDEAEAAVVKRIFAMFIRLKAASPIPERLNRDGLLNHRGRPFKAPFIRRMLRNRLYRGDIVHKGRPMAGAHPAIVSEKVWDQAQAVMAPHFVRWAGRNQLGRGMLAGLLFGPTGLLIHEAGVSKGKIYRYYGPPKRVRRELPTYANGRLRASDLEEKVLALVDPDGRLLCDGGPEAEACERLRSLVDRVDIGEKISVRLKSGCVIVAANDPWLKTSRLRRRPLILSN